MNTTQHQQDRQNAAFRAVRITWTQWQRLDVDNAGHTADGYQVAYRVRRGSALLRRSSGWWATVHHAGVLLEEARGESMNQGRATAAALWQIRACIAKHRNPYLF